MSEEVGEDPALCVDAGAFEADCRLRWVRRHAESDLEVLLEVCASQECRFDALEHKATGELLTDLARCDEHLELMASYCREHAAIRWLAEPTGVDRVVVAEGWPEDIGRALGHLHACAGGPACSELPEGKQAGCRSLVAEVEADPTICSR